MKNIPKQEMFDAQGGKCFYCFKKMKLSGDEKDSDLSTKDHFYPKCNGGKLNGNYVLSCAPCNRNKGHRQPTVSEKKRFTALYLVIKERRFEMAGGRGWK